MSRYRRLDLAALLSSSLLSLACPSDDTTANDGSTSSGSSSSTGSSSTANPDTTADTTADAPTTGTSSTGGSTTSSTGTASDGTTTELPASTSTGDTSTSDGSTTAPVTTDPSTSDATDATTNAMTTAPGETGGSTGATDELCIENGGNCFNPAACACVGCNTNGVCNIDDDCVCPDCNLQPFCAACVDDGQCDVYSESCACADCVDVPACTGYLPCIENGPGCNDPDQCQCVGCNDNGVCSFNEDCLCSDCQGQQSCFDACNGDLLCDVRNEGCACSDCASLPQCSGYVAPVCEESGPSCDDPSICVCAGCDHDGVCDSDDDCTCVDCQYADACVGAGSCNDDGICDVFAEGCNCADCSAIPACSEYDPVACVEDGAVTCTDLDLCSCLGCVDDGVCNPDEDDCICADCSAACAGQCNGDGICDPHDEGCDCGDCFPLPACGGSSGSTDVLTWGPGLAQNVSEAYNGTLGSMTCLSQAIVGNGVDAVVDVSLTVAMSHTWIGDMTIKVVSPAGSVITVLSRPGTNEVVDNGTEPNGFGDSADLATAFPVSYATGAPTDAESMGATLLGGADVVCEDDGLCAYFPNAGAALPGDFTSLIGQSAVGNWQVCFGDSFVGDLGVLDTVTLTVVQD